MRLLLLLRASVVVVAVVVDQADRYCYRTDY